MRKTLALLALAMITLASCTSKKLEGYYELIGGDPEIDYIYFKTPDTCLFVAPGPLKLKQSYTREGDTYTIRIIDEIYSEMKAISPDTLVGQPPFFEGVWIRRDYPTHK